MSANRHANSALAASIGCTMALLSSSASAQAVVDVSVSGNVQTNPYLRAGTGTRSEAVALQISPSYTASDEISSIALRGNLRVEEFARRYSTAAAYGAGINASRAISERVRLTSRASFNSTRSSVQDIAFSPLLDTAGNVIELPLNTDPTLFGQAERIKSFGGAVGAAITLSERDSLSTEGSFSAIRYESVGLRNHNQFGQSLAYARQLSQNTSLDLTTSVSYTDYRGRREGDALIVQPMLGLHHTLSDRVTMRVSVGGSHARIKQLIGPDLRQTGLALSGQICESIERRTICARVSRSTQPTALGEVRTQTSGGLSLDWQLPNRSVVRTGANYSRVSGNAIGATPRAPSGILGLFAEYEHRLSKRLGLFVGSNYADIHERGQPRRSNFVVSGGLRLRIGADK